MGFGGDAPALIEAMAQPLARFDASQVATMVSSRSAAAVAAAAGGAQMHQRDGLMVAVGAILGISDSVLAERAAEQGLQASTLAAVWLQGQPERLCQLLTGAFTLAILDERSGEALLATDRMGIQPLNWQLAGETLVFASSADALVRHPLTPGVLDHQGLYNYVYFHMVPSPGTVYQGQQRLLPGRYLHYRQGRVEEQ